MNHLAGRDAHSKHKKTFAKRKHWPIVASMSFAGLLTFGHAIGGIAGLIEGYKHTVEFFWPHPAEAHVTPASESPFTHILKDLRREFRVVKIKLEKAEKADFSALNDTFNVLKKLNDRNPSVWYYEAEIGRIEDAAHFDAEGCLVPGNFKMIDLKVSHTLFYQYLDTARVILQKMTGKNAGADSCYESESGVCQQRVAWVDHLLANDLYELGLHATDKDKAFGYFKRAADHVKLAKDYRPPSGPVGFAQCTDTLTLQAKVDAKLHEFQPGAVAAGKVN
jgi:hypothetical protein